MSIPTSPSSSHLNPLGNQRALDPPRGENFVSGLGRYPAWRREQIGLPVTERAYEHGIASSNSRWLAGEAPILTQEGARMTELPQGPGTTEAGEPTFKNKPADTFRPWNLPREGDHKKWKRTRFGGLFDKQEAEPEKTPFVQEITSPGLSHRRDSVPPVHSSFTPRPNEGMYSPAYHTKPFGLGESLPPRPTRFGDIWSVEQDQGYQRPIGLFGNNVVDRDTDAWNGIDRGNFGFTKNERIRESADSTIHNFHGGLFGNSHNTAHVLGHKQNPSSGAKLSYSAGASINIHIGGNRVHVKVDHPKATASAKQGYEADNNNTGVNNLFGEQHPTNLTRINIVPPEHEEPGLFRHSEKASKSITLTITLS